MTRLRLLLLVVVAGALAASVAAAVATSASGVGSTAAAMRVDWLVGATGQREILLAPEHGRPTTAVLYMHAKGEHVDGILADGVKQGILHVLLDQGWVVAAGEAHGDNWGNDASLRDVQALYADVTARYPVRNVLLLAQSMGGMDAFLTVADHLVPHIRALAGIYPVANLRDLYDGPHFRRSIDAAYGVTASRGYATATAGHDPVLLPRSAYAGVPMLLWSSPADTFVPKAQNADRIAAITGARVIRTRGQHGDHANFQPDVLLRFFRDALAGQARSATTATGTPAEASAAVA